MAAAAVQACDAVDRVYVVRGKRAADNELPVVLRRDSADAVIGAGFGIEGSVEIAVRF